MNIMPDKQGGEEMPLFSGSAVALITPFTLAGEVDWSSYDDLIEFHLKNKTDALVIAGTTGEGSTLSDKEQIDLIKRAVQVAKGKKPIIAGTGKNDTRHTIFLSQEAEKVGADALLIVTPYYNKTNYQGMLNHYTAIADAVNLPIILYHVPGRTGATLSPEQVAKLAHHPNIVAIKDATGDLDYTKAVIELTKDQEFTVFAGNDDLIYQVMALGGKGVISVVANVAPNETHDICQLFLEGHKDQSIQLQANLLPLINSLFVEVNPIPVKYLNFLLGWNENVYRLPLWEPSDPVKEILKGFVNPLSQYRKG